MTVRKRKDTGKWVSDFYYNGERIVKTLKFARTKKEAEQAEAVIMNQVFQQAYGFDAKPDKLFENFVIETFLPFSEANKRSFRGDVSVCRELVKAFKNKTLRQITPTAIETFKQELLVKPIVFENRKKKTKTKRKRKLATVTYNIRVLSKICSMAVDAEILESNPCRRVRMLRFNNQRTRVLSYPEERRLLIALKDNELVRRIVILALHTGMRRGEIFDLTWNDVDLIRRIILIQQSKSGKKRMVPMNSTVLELLKNAIRRGEFVFPSPRTGGRLDNIKRSFGSAVNRAEIKNLRFHDLRHTAATRMANEGANVFSLCAIFGWSDLRMALRYTHATESAIRRAVENLDNKPFSNVLVTSRKNSVLKSR